MLSLCHGQMGPKCLPCHSGHYFAVIFFCIYLCCDLEILDVGLCWVVKRFYTFICESKLLTTPLTTYCSADFNKLEAWRRARWSDWHRCFCLFVLFPSYNCSEQIIIYSCLCDVQFSRCSFSFRSSVHSSLLVRFVTISSRLWIF